MADRVILLDVNETLLDTAALDPWFQQVLDDGDAAPALERLQSAGLRLAALTNGMLDAARQQLENAELIGFFGEVFSADEVERFEPAPVSRPGKVLSPAGPAPSMTGENLREVTESLLGLP